MTGMAPDMGTPGGNMKPHRGTMILVFGILGFVICPIFGIVAWVMGNNDLKEIQAGTMDPSGEGITKAGKIIGMIATILAIISTAISLLLLVIFGAAIFTGAAAA